MEFGEWLRGELELRKLTLKEFASNAGVSKSAVSMWVNGKRTPDSITAVRIADVLELPADLVLTNIGYGMSLDDRSVDLSRDILELRAKQRDLRRRIADLEFELAEVENELDQRGARKRSLEMSKAKRDYREIEMLVNRDRFKVESIVERTNPDTADERERGSETE